MALLVRARLSSLDDDDDAASSVSSGAASPPLVSPTVRRAAVLGAPRVAAQLSSSAEDDEGEAFDDATDYGEEEEGDVLQEVSNGFFRVARLPPPISADEKPAGSPSASDSDYFGASEGSAGEGSSIARRSGLEGAAGVIAPATSTAVGSSLDGSLQSSSSVITVLADAAAFGDLVNVSDGFALQDDDNKQGGEDIVAEAVDVVMPEPAITDARGIPGAQMHILDSFKVKDGGSEHEVAELPPVGDATEEAGVERNSGDSNAKDGTPKQDVVTDLQEADTQYVASMDGTSDLLEFPENVDCPHSIVDGVSIEVDGRACGHYDDNGEPAFMPSKDATERNGKEIEDNVPSSKGIHFGLDDSDDEEIDEEVVNGMEIELADYAALAEVLRVANRSPEQGKIKVFPIESPESQQMPPTVVGVPRTSVASTPVLDVVSDLESQMTDEEKKLYRKVDMARIKYLRLVHRLGYDPEHHIARQLLYRLSLVEGFRRIRMANHSFELENAWKRALLLEAEGIDVLEFSCNVLVLGKTGVGKSATVNSIFGEDKSETDAFLPATSSVKEITGVVGGVKFRVIDTPGLGTTGMGEKSNRKVLHSIKKYIKRCPPDIVLYVDRIDTDRRDASDLYLLRCITKVLGPSIWSKTIITFTHSAAEPPEGPGGSPMKYKMVVDRRTNALQESIWQVANGHRIENAVVLVENHHLCRRNTEGEKVLPNGLIWRRFLLLLCYSHKMVGEIDRLSTRRAASVSLFGLHLQMPPLPYFLSSLLQSREHPKLVNVHTLDSDVGHYESLDEGQEDEEYDYDQLPPFKPLSKSQVAKLSKEQQKLYFDEYDYRTRLLKKKKLKEHVRRLKEMNERVGNSHDGHPDDVHDTDRSSIPDWALQSSFDSDDPVYRYRCLGHASNLLVYPVTNSNGWDHDSGFDGVGLQHGLDVAKVFPASLWVQVNKDKREFTVHLESSMLARHGEDVSTLAGFDIQTMMDQISYTLRGETKIKNFEKNTTTGGLSMTCLGGTMVTGAKVEDNLLINNRLMLAANTGAVSMRGDTAYGVNMEATLREKNYLTGTGFTTLGVSLVRWHKLWNVSANLDSQFSLGRTSNMTVHVDVNNKLSGRVRIKANNLEQTKITLLGVCSMAMYLWNKMHPCAGAKHE